MRSIVQAALADRRASLSEAESNRVLAAYRIPCGKALVMRDIAELREGAAGLAYPLTLKILSPDVRHKSEVSGVALSIADPAQLVQAAQGMMDRCREHRPLARIDGFSLQSLRHPGATSALYAGIALDRAFGPVIAYGCSGSVAGVSGQRVLALPPPDEGMARALLEGGEASRIAGVTHTAPLESLLVSLGQLALEVPEITQVDIDPVLLDEEGLIALDTHIAVAANSIADRTPLPANYPCELEQEVVHCGRRLLLRPVRPEDEPLQREFLTRITRQDLYRRFFTCVKQLPAQAPKLIDYEQEMTFVAITADDFDAPEILAVVQACASAQRQAAEFAILVRSDLKGCGLGRLLMRKLIAYCRARGTAMLWGQVLSNNAAMLRLSRELGFRTQTREGAVEEIALAL